MAAVGSAGGEIKPLNEGTCKVIMNMFDRSGEGRLVKKDACRLIHQFCGDAIMKDIDAASVLALADINNDKYIELDEISGLMRSLDMYIKPDTQSYLKAIWKKYDKNSNKILEKEELGQVLSDLSGGHAPTGREIDKILRRCSKDGNLDVSMFEFMFVINEWFCRKITK